MTEKPTVKYPIRWILLTTMIGLITVLVITLTTLHIYSHKSSLETELNKRVLLMKNNLSLIGRSLSETISRQAIINIAEYNFSNLTEQLHDAVLKNTDLSYAILMDQSQIVFIHTDNPSLKKTVLANDEDVFAAQQTIFTANEYNRNGQKYVEFITPIHLSSEIWGCLRLGFSYASLDREINESQRDIRQEIRNIITRSIWTSVLFIFASSLVIFYLARTMSKPLVNLTNAAHHLANGDFTAKEGINIHSHNEVGLLASAFVDMSENLKDHTENLEQKVNDRTQELHQTLENLKAAQSQLVESEKMASLGGLVAGIAHDINTPIGIGVTALSTLVDDVKTFETVYNDNTMSRSDLEKLLKSCKISTSLTQSNLERAAELIQSFKQVAIDQGSVEKRRFKLKQYINDIVVSLRPKIKKAGHKIEIKCDDEIELDSFPGFISQIIANLVLNSIIHAYNENESGCIYIDAEIIKSETLKITYADDGQGMTEAVKSKIFEPFFTTSRSRGGSGIGMHIVYNIVTQNLNGTISCESLEGQGTKFIITFPIQGAT